MKEKGLVPYRSDLGASAMSDRCRCLGATKEHIGHMRLRSNDGSGIELTSQRRQDRCGTVLAILGGGSMATAIANLIAATGRPCILWTEQAELVSSINNMHRHPLFFKEQSLSPSLRATTNLEETISSSQVLVLAVPSYDFRRVACEASRYVTEHHVVLSATKGFDPVTRKRMSAVLEEFLDSAQIGALSGPNLPADSMRGLPTPLVIASRSPLVTDVAAALFDIRPFLPVISSDLVGVELAGALKNVVALAIGMVAGLELGESLCSYIFTSGQREIERLGLELGADKRTFSGLAGIGDLYLTSTSRVTANRQLGVALARGMTLTKALDSCIEPPEGAHTTLVCHELARQAGVAMPLAEGVYRVLYENISASKMIDHFLHDLPTRAAVI